MKAILDHVGIAVRDLGEAVVFFRDALGLEVEACQEMESRRIRTQLVSAGSASLELLEGTAADSPLARFVDGHGPGLHHVALRIDDLPAALAQLKARGVKLLDEQPRRGPDGSPIAFIDPSSVHGVLVELKQVATSGVRGTAQPPEPVWETPRRLPFGDLELISLCDGFFHLDGGAMFGVVPKTLWEPRASADGRNRIRLAMRPLLVRGARTMLIDAGIGDKTAPKQAEIFGLERMRHLDHSLAEAGVPPDAIDVVLATHLHFDHAGGFTARDETGRLLPRFRRAQYIVRRGEWEDATAPNERNRASYLPENLTPLADAGVLQLIDQDATIMPGVRVRRTGGHTAHHQMVVIESGGQTAVVVGDLIPTVAHLPEAWIMGYDLYPLDTLSVKRTLLREAVDREYLMFFGHDPAIAAGYIRERDGKRRVERVL